MAREGADITIVYLPEEQVDAEDTKRMVEAEKRSCHLCAGDLINYETSRKAVESHVKRSVISRWSTDRLLTSLGLGHRFGRVNVLVNNASQQLIFQNFEGIDLDGAEKMFKTNVLQMFAITKYALPHMTKGDSYGYPILVHGRDFEK
jgi:NAD(P)-dependent dehydrogenase (short-subunit alcohol dehydrogenase family)